MFVDTLTADERCAVPECENLQFPIQMILSSTRNFFPQIFVRLMESTSNLKLFQKKKIVIANIFPKLQTVKDFVRPISKKRSFRISFHSQHVKGSQTLVKSAWEPFYHIFSSLWEEIIWKISPSLKFEILGVFVNTLTADYKCPVPDCENLLFPIQMQLP